MTLDVGFRQLQVIAKNLGLKLKHLKLDFASMLSMGMLTVAVVRLPIIRSTRLAPVWKILKAARESFRTRTE